MTAYDAIVVGSGPNGLTAAITLAMAGKTVLVVEAAASLGGGMRSAELTLPGFIHDTCSAVHPMAVLSPVLSSLPLAEHGLEWVYPRASVAHPLDEGRAVILRKSIEATVESLGSDGERWRHLVRPFLRDSERLFADLLAPLGLPRKPLTMARFGWLGLRSARRLAHARFRSVEGRALFAGCAAHSILPLEFMATAAVGLVFAISAHLVDWPVARGGSASLTKALASILLHYGGVIETETHVESLGQLPESRVVLFDTSPRQLAEIAGDALPSRWRNKLLRYNYGPGVFKLDWALSEEIPWRDPQCKDASTVHVGGTFDEIADSERAVWRGEVAKAPFLIVCQQSGCDDTRTPDSRHTGYAYCHVPAGCTVDMKSAIESQIERFAPGFRDTILATHVTAPKDFFAENPNYVGGAVTGGAANLGQLFARPVRMWRPYSTPNPRLYICSASSPPGGGVHGMCGYHAARAALRRLS